MALSVKYSEVLAIVKQLPPDDLQRLKAELGLSNAQEENKVSKLSRLQELLLNGPTMNDEQHQEFLQNRKHLNTWRKA